MKGKKKRGWFSNGMGSELMTVLISIMTITLVIYTCVFFGQLNSEIQAQVIADIIVDGSCAFAQNDMDVYQDALNIMAEKLYKANAEYNNGVELVSFSVDGPTSVGEYSGDYLDSDELAFLQTRATRVWGKGEGINGEHRGVKTPVWDNRLLNMFSTANMVSSKSYTDGEGKPHSADISKPQYEGIEDFQLTQEQLGYHYVDYDGPAFMDQIVTISVTAKCKMPVFNTLTTKTKSATTLCLANEPFNGRVTARTDYQQYFDELEKKAYEESYLTDEEKAVKNIQLVRHNSIKQKILLEARRAFGDGYYIPADIIQWPQLPRTLGPDNKAGYIATDGVGTGEYKGVNAWNKLKSCYHFISSCFQFDGLHGFPDAKNKLDYSHLIRRVDFERRISCEEIWEKMHPPKIKFSLTGTKHGHNDSGAWCTLTNGSWKGYPNTNVGDSALPAGSRCIDAHMKSGTYDSKTGACTMEYTYAPPPEMTLGDVITTYCAMEPSMAQSDYYVWGVSGYDALPELIPGDVLVWTDPNWFPHMLDELTTLAAIEREEDETLDEACPGTSSQFEKPSGKQECHWCIYIGDGKIVQMGGEVCISPNPGQTVNPPIGWTGPVIHQVYRFYDKGMDPEDGIGHDYSDGSDSEMWE